MPSRPVRPPSTTTRSPGCGPVGQRPVGGDADAAAEHERVRRVRRVVEHGAGDGRQADLVAVVGDAVDDALADAPRVQHAVGQLGERQVGRAEAQDVGAGDRAVGGAEHVADHAADAGVGAAERLDRRRVVVGLGLEGDRRAGDERDDPGVADERRPHERGGDGVGRAAQQAEQIDRLARAVGGGDVGAERLVGAVLAPRLGQRLQLDVGRIAPGRSEVVTDDRQLRGVEGQRPRGAEASEPGVVEVADGTTSTAGASSEPGWRSGVAGPDVQRSMIGLATSRRNRTSVSAPAVPGGNRGAARWPRRPRAGRAAGQRARRPRRRRRSHPGAA